MKEKYKINSSQHRFKHHKYGIVNYNIIDDFYIVLDKDENVVHDSRFGDIDIEMYIDYSSFNDM